MFFEKGPFSRPKTGFFKKRNVHLSKRRQKQAEQLILDQKLQQVLYMQQKTTHFSICSNSKDYSQNLNLYDECIRNAVITIFRLDDFLQMEQEIRC